MSSLIVAESRKTATDEGFLVTPHASVMITTQVVGTTTVERPEFLMNMCDELHGIDEWSGISPFVWWWYDDNYG